MDKAKAAVASFPSKRGHSIDVTESVVSGATREHIKPTSHEELTEAVDREVHQDHYPPRSSRSNIKKFSSSGTTTR